MKTRTTHVYTAPSDLFLFFFLFFSFFFFFFSPFMLNACKASKSPTVQVPSCTPPISALGVYSPPCNPPYPRLRFPSHPIHTISKSHFHPPSSPQPPSTHPSFFSPPHTFPSQRLSSSSPFRPLASAPLRFPLPLPFPFPFPFTLPLTSYTTHTKHTPYTYYIHTTPPRTQEHIEYIKVEPHAVSRFSARERNEDD